MAHPNPSAAGKSTPDKPLPAITDLTRPFWTAAKQGRLVLQKCQRCGVFNFHPKAWCIDCGCRDLVWIATCLHQLIVAHIIC